MHDTTTETMCTPAGTTLRWLLIGIAGAVRDEADDARLRAQVDALVRQAMVSLSALEKGQSTTSPLALRAWDEYVTRYLTEAVVNLERLVGRASLFAAREDVRELRRLAGEFRANVRGLLDTPTSRPDAELAAQ